MFRHLSIQGKSSVKKALWGTLVGIQAIGRTCPPQDLGEIYDFEPREHCSRLHTSYGADL